MKLHELAKLPVDVVANQLAVNLPADCQVTGGQPSLAAEVPAKGTASHGYQPYQIEYRATNDTLIASRMLAVIPPGSHTEFAYWSGEHLEAGCTERRLTIHRGAGALAIGRTTGPETVIEQISALATPEVALPKQCFWGLRNSAGGPRALIVSELCWAGSRQDQLSSEVHKGQETVKLPSGEDRPIPHGFQGIMCC